MATTKEKTVFWSLLCVVFIVFISAISAILLPFVVAILVAYFLDPAVDKLEDFGLSRTKATAMITVLFFVIVLSAAALLFPIVYDQLASLIGKVPEYIRSFQAQYSEQARKLFALVSSGSEDKAEEFITNYSGHVLKIVGGVLKNIAQSGAAVLNLMSLIFISPVISFFLLRDWDKMTAKIDTWFPRASAKIIREQLALIDGALSGYIRGQSNVCLILATFYGLGLSMVGLDSGLLIGIATGFLAFLPYVGMLIGMSVGLAVAFFQYEGDVASIAAVLAVYVVGQVIEGNFITPKLIGEKVGLHPVWIIFGLLAAGTLFGIVGVLVAIPVTATVGVLMRFAMKIYLGGDFYQAKKTRTIKK